MYQPRPRNMESATQVTETEIPAFALSESALEGGRGASGVWDGLEGDAVGDLMGDAAGMLIGPVDCERLNKVVV